MEDRGTTPTKRPWHLWVVGILGLLWTAMGAVDYVMTQGRNEAYLSQFSAEELAFFTSIPKWTVASWATSIWSGLLGCILLLFRSKWAVSLFWVSLIAFVVTAIQNFLMASPNMMEVVGPFALAFSAVIGLICIALLFYARRMQSRGVLR